MAKATTSAPHHRLSFFMAPHRKALVRCDATRLVPRERTGSRAPAGLVLEIDVGERRAVVVTNNKGCLVDFFNVPRSREAALLHFIRHSKVVASLISLVLAFYYSHLSCSA